MKSSFGGNRKKILFDASVYHWTCFHRFHWFSNSDIQYWTFERPMKKHQPDRKFQSYLDKRLGVLHKNCKKR